MGWFEVDVNDEIATVALARGKVNALNGEVVAELAGHLDSLESNQDVRALVLTGRGKFFSFGFDIPEFLSFPRERFAEFVTDFTKLYMRLFLYPKPVVAALNGHAIAGGCMLALACDSRLMVPGGARISLNEIAFGSSVFAGATEMLRFWVGSANATRILTSGAMFTAPEARVLGLVQDVLPEEDVLPEAVRVAANLASKHPDAFASIKSLLRRPVADEMARRERDSIREFIGIWYSPRTWANLREIRIRA